MKADQAKEDYAVASRWMIRARNWKDKGFADAAMECARHARDRLRPLVIRRTGGMMPTAIRNAAVDLMKEADAMRHIPQEPERVRGLVESLWNGHETDVQK